MAGQNHMHILWVYYTVYATGGNFEAHKILQVN